MNTWNALHVLALFVLRAWCLTTMQEVTLADALGGKRRRERGAQVHYSSPRIPGKLHYVETSVYPEHP